MQCFSNCDPRTGLVLCDRRHQLGYDDQRLDHDDRRFGCDHHRLEYDDRHTDSRLRELAVNGRVRPGRDSIIASAGHRILA